MKKISELGKALLIEITSYLRRIHAIARLNKRQSEASGS
jgi:hypothetical protein